jgi:outer membrane biosynthesis protein TonB
MAARRGRRKSAKKKPAKKSAKKKTTKKKAIKKKPARRKPARRPAAKKRPAKKKPAKRTKPKRPAAKKAPKKAATKRTAASATIKAVKKPARKPVAAKPAMPAVPPGTQPIGRVIHYYSHLNVAVISLDKGPLQVGDVIHIKGHTTDFRQPVQSMQVEHVSITKAVPGDDFGLKVIDHAREHDIVYRVLNP